MAENKFYLAFSIAAGVGPKGFQKLLKLLGTAEKAWDGSSGDFNKAGVGEVNFAKFDAFRKTFEINEYLSKLRKSKVEFVPMYQVNYSSKSKIEPSLII